VRRGQTGQQFAFAQGVINQPQLPLRQIAQTAVDQLGGTRGGLTGEIAAVDQRYAQPAQGGVARHRGAVDAAADHGEVELFTP
jgi:hypothetical protein